VRVAENEKKLMAEKAE